jgi:outer membrane scaffolding protein for murein synthesis (MipA/OmpV family)
MTRLSLPLLCLLSAAATSASAENRLVFQLGGGVQSAPGYFGSDETVLGPDLAFSFAYASLGGFEVGNPDPFAPSYGFGFGGSFGYVAGRSAADFPELAGLEDLDASLELGGKVTYAGPGFEAFAAVRNGVTGHESLVAEAGVDAVWRVDDRLSLSLGPRAVYGSDDYADYFYGVSAAEASASSFGAYEADGGLMSVGLVFGMDYRMADAWSLYGEARFDQLRGSAADSPISVEDDQLSVSIGVTRVFDWRF